jgi:hypothetical protein
MMFPAEPGCRGGVVCCRDNVDGSAGFAQAGPMLNSTPITQRVIVALDCSLALNDRAMLSASSPRKRVIQYSETPVMEAKPCGILDTRVRGYDGLFRHPRYAFFVMRKMPRKKQRKTQQIRNGKCQEKALTMANFRHTIAAKLGDPT